MNDIGVQPKRFEVIVRHKSDGRLVYNRRVTSLNPDEAKRNAGVADFLREREIPETDVTIQVLLLPEKEARVGEA